MKRSGILAAVALLAMVVVGTAGVTAPQNFTAGKAIADSLAATADVFTATPLPAKMDSMAVWAANDSLTLYTIDIQVGAVWYTLDTTSVAAGTVGTIYSIPGQYAGLTWRLTADNQTATTCYARQYLAVYK